MSDDTDVTTRPDDLASPPENGSEGHPTEPHLDPLDGDSEDVVAVEPGPPALAVDDEVNSDQSADDVETTESAPQTDEGAADAPESSTGRRGGSRLRLLEREGEVAADFL